MSYMVLSIFTLAIIELQIAIVWWEVWKLGSYLKKLEAQSE